MEKYPPSIASPAIFTRSGESQPSGPISVALIPFSLACFAIRPTLL